MPSPVADRASNQRSSTRSVAADSWRIAYLTLRVHADAFLYDPFGYLQGVGWRVRGLKLRSRNRIAALAGRSQHAYDLWIARDEPNVRAGQPRDRTLSVQTIVPVIDCRETSEGLGKTLASLGDGAARCVLIGGNETSEFPTVDRPRGIVRHVSPAGTWLCPLVAGDRLADGALTSYAAVAAEAGRSFVIYADDDMVDVKGRRVTPHFKPDWNPDLFEHHDFISGSAIVKVDAGDLSALPDHGWIQTLMIRAIEKGGDPAHLPVVLHHRKGRPTPVIPARPKQPILADPPRLTAIVPTRNHVRLLRTCIEGLQQTAYPEIESIVIDNGSDDPETVREKAGLLANLRAACVQKMEQKYPGHHWDIGNTDDFRSRVQTVLDEITLRMLDVAGFADMRRAESAELAEAARQQGIDTSVQPQVNAVPRAEFTGDLP